MSPNQNTIDTTTDFVQIQDMSDTSTIPASQGVYTVPPEKVFREFTPSQLRKILQKHFAFKNKVAARRAKNKMARTARKKNRK